MRRTTAMAVCIVLTAGTVDTSLAIQRATENDILKSKLETIELTAKKKRKRRVVTEGNSGVLVSHKTGAKAYVAPQYAARFQNYINDLEAFGGKVLFMGGYRRGRCDDSRYKHPCGKALDVCQLSRGEVDKSCNLPGKIVMAALAMKNGLFEGALWCDGDYGHAQVGISAEACRQNLYAAVKKFKSTLMAKLDDAIDQEAKVFDYSQVVVADVEDNVKSKLHATRTYAARKHKRYARRHHARTAYVQPTSYDMQWGTGQ